MLKQFRTIAFGHVAFAVSLAALAQTAAPPSAAPSYNSAFESYRPFFAEEVGDWRKANETVREIGGWRSYAKEIQGESQGAEQPAPASSAGSARPVASAPLAASTSSSAPPQPTHPHQGHQR